MTAEIPEVTREDLARLIIYAAVKSPAPSGLGALGLGTIRNAFKTFRDLPGDLIDREIERRGLPFTEREWEVLGDMEALWREVKQQLSLPDDGSFRIVFDPSTVPREAWRGLPSKTLSHTLLFGSMLAELERTH